MAEVPRFIRYRDTTVSSVIVVSVQVEYVGNYHELEIFNLLAAYLREAVHQDVRRVGEVYGFVSVQSEESNANEMYDSPVRLGSVDGVFLQNMLVNIQNSNEDVLLNELVWTFEVIFGPLLAGGNARMPSWWGDRSKWKALWNVPDDVSCLAMSLCYSMKGLNTCGNTYDKRPEQGIKNAKELMHEMQWSKFVSLAAIDDFVQKEKYSHYQVIVMTHETFLKANDDFIFTGRNFVPQIEIVNGERCETKANRLYLFYDINQMHMVALRNVQATFEKIRGYRIAWCHKCHIGWNASIRVHTCGLLGIDFRRGYGNEKSKGGK